MAEGPSGAAFSENLDVGDWIDVREPAGAWYGSRLLDKRPDSALVQLPVSASARSSPGSDAEHQQQAEHSIWLTWGCGRLAPFRSHSASQEYQRRTLASLGNLGWDTTIADSRQCGSKLARLQAALPEFAGTATAASDWTPAKVTSVLCGDVPDLVDRLLAHDYQAAGASAGTARALEANRFFLQCLRFIAAYLPAFPQLVASARQVRPKERAAVAEADSGAASACAGACARVAQELIVVFARIVGTIDRKGMCFLENFADLPERNGTSMLWPGAETDWLRAAVSASAAGLNAAGLASEAASAESVITSWIAIKLKGLDLGAESTVPVGTLEEALQRMSLLQFNTTIFCVLGGVEGLLLAMACGCTPPPSIATADDTVQGGQPLPLDAVKALLVTLGTMLNSQSFSKPWAASTLPRLMVAVRGRIMGMWDEEVKTVDRDQIVRCICEPAVSLMAARLSRTELDELREELFLLFARRRLQSPFLERRLKALGCVKESIDRVSPRHNETRWGLPSFWGSTSSRERDRERDKERWDRDIVAAGAAEPLLTTSGLARWLADEERYGLLPILTGARAHPEVLRRSTFLLRFLAREQLLTRPRLSALWTCGCSAAKHEDLTTCVLDLFMEIAPLFDWEQIHFLVGKVVEISPQSIDTKFLRFLRDLLITSVRARKNTSDTGAASNDGGRSGIAGDAPIREGLAVFWRTLRTTAAATATSPPVLAAAPAPPAVSIAAEARSCFLDLLRSSYFATHRLEYLQKCWGALVAGPVSIWVVRLLRDLLGTFVAGSPSGGASASDAWTADGEALTRDIVLQRFGEEYAGEARGSLSGFLLNRAQDSLTSESAQDREELTSAILETLLYVLAESSLQVSFDDVSLLWDSARGAGAPERDLVARWLSRAAGLVYVARTQGRHTWEVWPETEYVRFFREVLSCDDRMDFRAMSHDELGCFVNYMKLCNLKIFNRELVEDMIHIPETPNYGGGASSTSSATNSGASTSTSVGGSFSYGQLIGEDGAALRSGELATAVGKRFRVLRVPLLGVEELWQIALQIRDPTVFESCADVLLSCVVYIHPSSSLYRKRSEVQTTFLQRCMHLLEPAPATASASSVLGSPRAQPQKALAFIAKLIIFSRQVGSRRQISAVWPLAVSSAAPCNADHANTSGSSIALGGSSSGRGELASAFHIAFRLENNGVGHVGVGVAGGGGNLSQRTVYLPRSSHFGSLRSKVASVLRLNLTDTALYTYPGMQLLDWDLDCLTLHECQMPDVIFAAYVRPSASGDQNSPVWQMNERDADTLLDLLHQGPAQGSCRASVWAILARLPVHCRAMAMLGHAARWGLEVGPAVSERPLSQLIPSSPVGDVAAIGGKQTAVRGALEEFRKFWSSKVWPTSHSQHLPHFNPAPTMTAVEHRAAAVAPFRRPAHRLLYTLQVVQGLLASGDPDPPAEPRLEGESLLLSVGHSEEPLTGDRWSLGFLQAGGLELFFAVFAELLESTTSHGKEIFSADDSANDDATSCFSLLAECMRRLLVRWQTDAATRARTLSGSGSRAGAVVGVRTELDQSLRGRLPAFVPQVLDALFYIVTTRSSSEVADGATTKGYGGDEANLDEIPDHASYSASALLLCKGVESNGSKTQSPSRGHEVPAPNTFSTCVSRMFGLLELILENDSNSCVVAVRTFPQLGSLLQEGLLTEDAQARDAFARGIHALCIQDPTADNTLSGTLLAKLLFEALPQWRKQPARANQLFGLVAGLLQRRRSPQPAAMGLVPQSRSPAPSLEVLLEVGDHPPLVELLESLVGQLRTGGLFDDCDGGNDSMILGLIQLLHSIVHSFPQLKGPVSQNLVTELLRCFLGSGASTFLAPVPGATAEAATIPVGETEDHRASCAQPRCQTNKSRQAALALLLELSSESLEGCLSVAQLLLAAGVGLPLGPLTTGAVDGAVTCKSSEWSIHPDIGSKSSTGFVGLKNLGATCYVNSVIQQLFAHREFRSGVLAQARATKERIVQSSISRETNATATTASTGDDRTATNNAAELLYQLQVLFSSLRSSQRQYYSPDGFCAAFRDWEGNPVNVLQQMDADEFMILLMEQLEKAMGDTSKQSNAGSGPESAAIQSPENKNDDHGDGCAREEVATTTLEADISSSMQRAADVTDGTSGKDGETSLLQQLFGGTTCTEIIPKEPAVAARCSERRENFTVLSLQVKGKTSVHASLAAFVEGETLEGDNAYYSEEAGCKVDAIKRTSISSLPETLILALKRFEFDYDTMQKVKLNSLCEFPVQLDMWPYTKEALDESRSCSRNASRASCEYLLRGVVLHSGTADSGHYSSLVKASEDNGRTQWYEFNDTMVTPFNEEDIPQEAFGSDRDDEMGGRVFSDGQGGAISARSKNAYLLFYERVHKAEAVDAEAPGSPEHADNGSILGEGVTIQRSVEVANRRHWHTQAVFSTEFAEFAWIFVSNFYSSPLMLLSAQDFEVSTCMPEKAERQLLESIGALKFMQVAQLRRDIGASTPTADSSATSLEKCQLLPLCVTQFAASFFFAVLARSGPERGALLEWCSLLCRLLQRSGDVARRWFASLFSSHGFVRETFLECPAVDTRVAALTVASQALRWLHAEEAPQLAMFTAAAPTRALRHGQLWTQTPDAARFKDTETGGIEDDVAERAATPPLLVRIWATFIELLPVALQVEAHPTFAQYFELIREFLRLGPEARAWAAKTGTADELIRFVIQETNAVSLEDAEESGRRWYQPNWLRVPPPIPSRSASAPGSSPPAEPAGSATACDRERDDGGEVVIGPARGRGVATSGDADASAVTTLHSMRRPVSVDDFYGPLGGCGARTAIGMSGVNGSSPVCVDEFLRGSGEVPIEESFERLLRSELATDVVELGPLWGALALLFEADMTWVALHSEEIDALLRRIVRLGGVTLASNAAASRLIQQLCKGDIGRSRATASRVAECVQDSENRALRVALRAGSALVDISDGYAHQRCVFLLKTTLRAAKNQQKHYRTMQLVIRYVVKWCLRRPELPQKLMSDATNDELGPSQYRWLESWMKDVANGGDASAYHSRQDAGSRWTWCADLMPYVKKIVRGESLAREAASMEPYESDRCDNESTSAATAAPVSAASVAPSAARGRLVAGSRLPLATLSKAQATAAGASSMPLQAGATSATPQGHRHHGHGYAQSAYGGPAAAGIVW